MKKIVKRRMNMSILCAGICLFGVALLGGCGVPEEDEPILSPDAIVQYMPSSGADEPGSTGGDGQQNIDGSEVPGSEEPGNSGEGVGTEGNGTEESGPEGVGSEGTAGDVETESSQPESVEPEPERIEHPYADWYKQNSDMVAWLTIPGMKIDYPVMQTPGDEEFYLRKGFDKKKDNAGCLILDTDSSLDPLGTNLMIHGHNMKSGKMFGTLMEYKDKDFYEDHQIITLYTKDVQKNYQVMAVFYSQVYKKSDQVFKFYQFFQADTEAEFNNFYDNIMKMSVYDTGVTAEFGDRFVTLVTCAYHVDNGRFVVVAKEIEDGDYYLPIE